MPEIAQNWSLRSAWDTPWLQETNTLILGIWQTDWHNYHYSLSSLKDQKLKQIQGGFQPWFFSKWKHVGLNFSRIFQLGDGCTSLQSEINNSLTSGQATVKRDLVLAPGRQGEAVCPLNALLQSQQPLANSLSLMCRTLCSVARLPVRLSATQHMPCWRQRPFTHFDYLGPSDRLSICQSK